MIRVTTNSTLHMYQSNLMQEFQSAVQRHGKAHDGAEF